MRSEVEEWWREVLKSPKNVVAPMVDASELPWRLLSRRYKADLCFTPMIHSRNFVQDPKYRADHLQPCKCPEDRPLIVQFCGNDPEILREAAEVVKPFCDGVDLNLGCPQSIAKRGHYGAFLQDEWDLIARIVKEIGSLGIPVSCKVRVFNDVEKSVAYAKTLEAAGCWMLTVHGRTIDQKGPLTGLASWAHIKAIKEALSIPVIANGNIQYQKDVDNCIAETGVNGVMSAEGNLHNPALFAGVQPFVWDVALEYLELAKKYPCPLSYSRGHIFKLYYHLLIMDENRDLREMTAKAGSLQAFEQMSLKARERWEPKAQGREEWIPSAQQADLPFPPWMCQPYVRPAVAPPANSRKPPSTSNSDNEDLFSEHQSKIIKLSKKRLKRMERNPHKNWNALPRVRAPLCQNCGNPAGLKCTGKYCRKCCFTACTTEVLNCEGHRFFVKTNREKALEDSSQSSPPVVLTN